MKEDVEKSIPVQKETIVWVELTAIQKKVYLTHQSWSRTSIIFTLEKEVLWVCERFLCLRECAF